MNELSGVVAPAGPFIGRFDNSYRLLPQRFYQVIAPAAAPAPRLIAVNYELADELGLALRGLDEGLLAGIFSGKAVPAGAQPIAQAYAGHQFGGFSPQLGDGRANLLGEILDPQGRRWDIQLKGSGRTAFSRGGDGKAALGPVLREYLISEAMFGLGIPATRALAAVTTGETVMRDGGPVPGAVFTRVAASHVRVGTFQFFTARGDAEGLRLLADYVIDRHYRHLTGQQMPYLKLLEAVIDRQAALVALWMGVGFIHGVMNTDNMAISGETIDFGPCAFMDAYDPATVYSAIDSYGRYAYQNQPAIAQWNLARFAETLLPLFGMEDDEAVALATEAVNGFAPAYAKHWLAVMRAKLGLEGAEDGDAALARDFLDLMQAAGADFTLTFRALCDAAAGAEDPLRRLLASAAGPDAWLAAWRARTARETSPAPARAAAMRNKNPAFIPRNHRVEQAIKAAVTGADFTPFETLARVLTRPYDEQAEFADFTLPPSPEERVLQTFCGT